MKFHSLVTVIVFWLFPITVNAQTQPWDDNNPSGELERGYRNVKLWAKGQEYKSKAKNSVYTVSLKDGRSVKASSKILLDAESGICFFYYTEGESTIMIFPEKTLKVTRTNPYDTNMLVEGLPVEKGWRFQVLEGKIKAFSFFLKGNQPDEIQYNDTPIEPFDSERLQQILADYPQAMEYFMKKDYYNAINIYNVQTKYQ